MSSEHFESTLICFCSVIEAVSANRREEEFMPFDHWIKEQDRLEDFIEDLNSGDAGAKIDDWYDRYREIYGVRRNFGRTVAEAYRSLNLLPGFLKMKTEEIEEGIKRSSDRDIEEDFEDIDEAYEEVEQTVKKKIYDEYRSKLVHEGIPLNFVVSIKSKIGAASAPGDFSMQGVANVAFTVLKVEIRDSWDER